MSTPLDSIAPPDRTPSSPTVVTGWSPAVQAVKALRTWLAGLSPAGATSYEATATGSLEAGYAGSWTATRYGKVVVLSWTCSTSIAAAGAALPLLILPVGWRPLGDVAAAVSGTSLYSWSGAVRSNGQIQVRNTHTAAQTSMFGTATYRVA